MVVRQRQVAQLGQASHQAGGADVGQVAAADLQGVQLAQLAAKGRVRDRVLGLGFGSTTGQGGEMCVVGVQIGRECSLHSLL